MDIGGQTESCNFYALVPLFYASLFYIYSNIYYMVYSKDNINRHYCSSNCMELILMKSALKLSFNLLEIDILAFIGYLRM